MKKNMFKGVSAAIISLAALMAMSTTAFATEKTDPIDSVSLSFAYELAVGMGTNDIDVECDTDGIKSITVSSVTNTVYGKRPTVTIKLKADTSDGYYFDKEDKSVWKSEEGFELTGDEAEYKSSSYGSTSSVTLVVRLPKIGSDNEDGLSVSEVSWDEDGRGVISWEEAEDATKYDVRLLRNGSSKESFTTTSLSYNMGSYIRKYGYGAYSVRVRGTNGNYHGEWEESEELDVDESNMGDVSNSGGEGSYNGGSSYYSGSGTSYNSGSTGGAWLRDSVGLWYCNADRSYTTNNWQQIDGNWYWFNASGYVVTGWQQSPFSGKWYYLDPNSNPEGRMLTNTYIGSYYVGADGAWVQ